MIRPPTVTIMPASPAIMHPSCKKQPNPRKKTAAFSRPAFLTQPPSGASGHLIPVFCGQVREQRGFSLARQRLAPIAHPESNFTIPVYPAHRHPAPCHTATVSVFRRHNTSSVICRQIRTKRLHLHLSVIIHTDPANTSRTPHPFRKQHMHRETARFVAIIKTARNTSANPDIPTSSTS